MPDELNDALGRIGFRRSQTVAYRPSCPDCRACVSVRVVADEFRARRHAARAMLKRNGDLDRHRLPPLGDRRAVRAAAAAISPRAIPAAAWRRWTRSISPTWSSIRRSTSFIVEYREPPPDGEPRPAGRRLPDRPAGRRPVDDLQLLRSRSRGPLRARQLHHPRPYPRAPREPACPMSISAIGSRVRRGCSTRCATARSNGCGPTAGSEFTAEEQDR